LDLKFYSESINIHFVHFRKNNIFSKFSKFSEL
ncbi:hypothetical protein T4D_5266, partial [Trichinella pseudospiralis]